MMKAKQMRLIAKAYKQYSIIESDADLRRNKLTLAEYSTIPVVFNTLQLSGRVKVFQRGVADWAKRLGFSVTMDEDNVNYIITM